MGFDGDGGDGDGWVGGAAEVVAGFVEVVGENVAEHVEAFEDLAEDNVGALAVEQGGVVGDGEEELRVGAVGSGGARHRQLSGPVGEVRSLVPDQIAGAGVAGVVGVR